MAGLQIAPNLELPAEAVTQTFAILAKRGVGKTYTASVMTEEMLKANLHVIVIDPIGVWWGLRAAANGRDEGLPIIIAGGDHADIPLDASGGEALANLIVDNRFSMVLDLSLLRKGEHTRFMTDFAETLYHKNRNAVHLILDEADAFAPQRPFGNEARMLGAVEDIVRRGRARGIGVTMITQRPSVLNKNVLTQIEVLVALRLTAPLDQKAIDEWVKTHAEESQRDIFMASLPALPVGTAWFWSPGWLNIFTKVKVRKRETFDSSSTPKVGVAVKAPQKLAPVDLEKLRMQLAATIEQAEAEDPKALKRQVADLRQQLTTAKGQARVEVREVMPAGLADSISSLVDTAGKLHEATTNFYADAIQLRDKYLPKPSPPTINTPPAVEPLAAGTVIVDEGMPLRPGEQRILEVLTSSYPLGFTRNQLATLAQFTARGGTYGNYYSNLKRQGLLEEDDGQVKASAVGLALLGIPADRLERPLSSADKIKMWREVLPPGPLRIFNSLVASYPRALKRTRLAELSGFAASGGTFGNYLATLRRNSLATVKHAGPHQVIKANKELFEEGK